MPPKDPYRTPSKDESKKAKKKAPKNTPQQRHARTAPIAKVAPIGDPERTATQSRVVEGRVAKSTTHLNKAIQRLKKKEDTIDKFGGSHGYPGHRKHQYAKRLRKRAKGEREHIKQLEKEIIEWEDVYETGYNWPPPDGPPDNQGPGGPGNNPPGGAGGAIGLAH